MINLDQVKLEMKHPCKTCPFRQDINPFNHVVEITPERLKDPAPLQKAQWGCHHTTNRDEAGFEELAERTQQCVGILMMLERNNTPHLLHLWAEVMDIDVPKYQKTDDGSAGAFAQKPTVTVVFRSKETQLESVKPLL